MLCFNYILVETALKLVMELNRFLLNVLTYTFNIEITCVKQNEFMGY